MKPPAPIPEPAAVKPSYDMGTDRSVTTALATPENTALTDRPAPSPLPTASITSPNGVPNSTSPTSGATTSPTTVATRFPGDSAVPIERNQSAPRARIHGTFDNVSTLFTRVGFGAATPSAGCQPLTMSVANNPCSYGGNKRGSGGLPSMTSSIAFSSPNRYSSGPCTMVTRQSVQM